MIGSKRTYSQTYLSQFVPEAGIEKCCNKSRRQYRLKGFRPNNRKVIVPGSTKEAPIRMVQSGSIKKVASPKQKAFYQFCQQSF